MEVAIDPNSLPSGKTEESVSLSWHNLSYTVPHKSFPKTGKVILNNISGHLTHSTMTAVLGASGAGKSSFLDAVAGRVQKKFLTGDVLVNGLPSVEMKQVSRYCTQEDALFSTFTVFETLMYAAHFNLPKKTGMAAKQQIVEELLAEFGLETARKTAIGGPFKKGCSGGQIRRVSVAAQVIGMTSGILFLDEPTSGLDTAAAAAVMASVRRLTEKHGATVIATIHQPSSETFQLFTHLLLLARGQTVYFGPRDDAITYFEGIGRPIPTRSNPADVYLYMTNMDFSSPGEESLNEDRLTALNSLISSYKETTNHKVVQEIQKLRETPGKNPDRSFESNGFLYQTKTLMTRAFVNAAKNPLAYWTRLAMYIALGGLMGSVFMRMGTNQSNVQDRLSAIFFGIAFMGFMSVAGIPAFLEERHVFLREFSNGLYSIEAYLLSNFLVSTPFLLIITLCFSGVAYYSVGFQDGWEKLGMFVGILYLTLMIAEAQTVLISVLIPIFVASLAVSAFANGVWLIVQGYFIQKQNIPDFWRYSIHQIDFQKYAFELLIHNELTGLTFSCEDTNCSCIIPPRGSEPSCAFTGEDVLAYNDYEDIDTKMWIVYLVVILLAFRFLLYFVMKGKSLWNKYYNNWKINCYITI